MNRLASVQKDGKVQKSRVRRVALVAPLWMRVPPSSYGGTELIIHLLVEELVNRGYDVTLFAPGDSNTSAKLREVLPCSLTRAMTDGIAYEYEHYVNASFAESILAGDAFDLIHAHLGYPQLAMGALARVPALFTLHTVPTIDDRWLLGRFPHLAYASVSSHQAASFPDTARSNVAVVHNGIDFDAYRASTQAGNYFAFLGRMGPQKSPLDAIRIAKLAGVPLILAGQPQNAAEIAYFEREVAPLIDGLTVRHIGFVNHTQKNDLLAGAGALLFPIQGEEAFGLAMIEAMACGTPVVAWSRASVPEIVDFGVTGYYGDTVEALALLARRALKLDRVTVRNHARSRFSHLRMVDSYEALYQQLGAHIHDPSDSTFVCDGAEL